MRRLHDVFQARLLSLQKVRAKLSSQVAMLAGSQRLGHGDYSRIFASIQTLNHTVALEQKLRHECTMLTCSNFTAYQVGHLARLRAVLLLSPRNQSCQMPHDLWGMLTCTSLHWIFKLLQYWTWYKLSVSSWGMCSTLWNAALSTAVPLPHDPHAACGIQCKHCSS